MPQQLNGIRIGIEKWGSQDYWMAHNDSGSDKKPVFHRFMFGDPFSRTMEGITVENGVPYPLTPIAIQNHYIAMTLFQVHESKLSDDDNDSNLPLTELTGLATELSSGIWYIRSNDIADANSLWRVKIYGSSSQACSQFGGVTATFPKANLINAVFDMECDANVVVWKATIRA